MVKELGHIGIAVLLDEENIVFKHHVVVQCHDVCMLQLHQNGDLSDGCGWNAIIFVVDMRLLDGIFFSGLHMDAFVNAAIGTPTQLTLILILVQLIVRDVCWVLLLLLLLLSSLLLLLWIRLNHLCLALELDSKIWLYSQKAAENQDEATLCLILSQIIAF